MATLWGAASIGPSWDHSNWAGLNGSANRALPRLIDPSPGWTLDRLAQKVFISVLNRRWNVCRAASPLTPALISVVCFSGLRSARRPRVSRDHARCLSKSSAGVRPRKWSPCSDTGRQILAKCASLNKRLQNNNRWKVNADWQLGEWTDIEAGEGQGFSIVWRIASDWIQSSHGVLCPWSHEEVTFTSDNLGETLLVLSRIVPNWEKGEISPCKS